MMGLCKVLPKKFFLDIFVLIDLVLALFTATACDHKKVAVVE